MNASLKDTHGFGARNGVKILVYGKAGRGKTRLCATAPTPVILSAEGGLLSIADYHLPYWEMRNITDLRDAFTWARSSQEAKQFETICLDSISEIAEVVLSNSKARVKDGRMAYGEMIDDMTKLIKEFRDLQGFHVYMSCKQERIKDDQSGVILNGPMMPGSKLGQAIPYLPDEVFQIDINENPYYHFLRCRPDFSNDAKDRSGKLEPIEEPHLGKIISKITLATA